MPSVKCPVCGQSFSTAGVAACPYCDTPLGPEFDFASAQGPSISYPSWLGVEQAITDPPLSQLSPSGASPPDTSSLALPWKAMWAMLKPSRPMRLEGVIVSVQTHQEDATSGNLLASFLTILKDLLWLSETRTGDHKRTITVIRLRTHNGIHRDARLDGEPRGALLATGDNLLLWGRYRRGVFVVRKGFNHTSEAEIYSSERGAASLTSLIVLGALLIILLVLFHFWPWSHLPFWLHFP
jgi:hypothetical protein